MIKFIYMKKVDNFIKDKGGYLLLLVHYVLMVYYENLAYIEMLDGDIAADLMLAQSMAKNNEWILASDFYYTTEVHVLHTQLIQQILFRFTDNYRIVFVASFAIFFAIVMIFSYFLIYKLTKNHLYSSIGTLLFTGCGGTYYEFNFYTQAFIVYIIVTLLFLYLYFKLYMANEYGRNYKINIASLIVLSFLMGACGLRFFSLIFIPIICLEAWLFFKENLHKETIKIDKRHLIRVLLCICPAILSYFIFKHPTNVKTELTDARSVFYGIYTFIIPWLTNCFGSYIYEGQAIVSKGGIMQVYFIGIAYLVYILVLAFLITNKKIKKNNQSHVTYLGVIILVFTVLSNIFFIDFTTLIGTDRERYLSIALFLILPLSVCCLYYLDINPVYKKICLTLFLIYVALFDYSKITIANESKQEIPNYIYAIENEGYEYGISLNYWYSNKVIALSNAKIEMGTYSAEQSDDDWFYKWGTLKSYEDKNPEYLLYYQDEEDLDTISLIIKKYNFREVYNDGWAIVYGK